MRQGNHSGVGDSRGRGISQLETPPCAFKSRLRLFFRRLGLILARWLLAVLQLLLLLGVSLLQSLRLLLVVLF